MRSVFQGKEVTVTVKTTGRNLTTEEIVAGFQLATGNFEALFLEQDSSSNSDYSDPSPDEKADVKKNGWIEKGEWVDVEVICPFCGFTGKTGTRWGNNFCKCPDCKEKLYNKYATGISGEKNKIGCVYLADEPMIFKDRMEQDMKMFGESADIS